MERATTTLLSRYSQSGGVSVTNIDDIFWSLKADGITTADVTVAEMGAIWQFVMAHVPSVEKLALIKNPELEEFLGVKIVLIVDDNY